MTQLLLQSFTFVEVKLRSTAEESLPGALFVGDFETAGMGFFGPGLTAACAYRYMITVRKVLSMSSDVNLCTVQFVVAEIAVKGFR